MLSSLVCLWPVVAIAGGGWLLLRLVSWLWRLNKAMSKGGI